MVQGFLELVERDACAIWWYNRLRRGEIDIDRLGDGYVSDMRARYAAMGRSLWVLDVTSDFGIPVVVAVLHWKDDSRERTVFAAGAHFDLRTATLQAATELNQILAVGKTTRRVAFRPATTRAMPCRCAGTPISCLTARRRFAGLWRRDFQRSIGASRCWPVSSLRGAAASTFLFSTRPGLISGFPWSA